MQKSKTTSIVSSKKPLLGYTQDEIKNIIHLLNTPAFTSQQITDWLYKKNVSSIDEMTNISLLNRNKLKNYYCIGKKAYSHKYQSIDGTIKYIFPITDKQSIETVYIPEKGRATLCISSQVGCKMNCAFCLTGQRGFKDQLSAVDMLNQILSISERNSLSNLVFMGMGEPLDNPVALFRALEILTSNYGLSWSPKRITISTVGNLPGIERFLKEAKAHLAISLHSPFHEERMAWIPIEKIYPIAKIISFIRTHNFYHQRKISFEYIAFSGLNDDIKHAEALYRLLKGIHCRVNLIKYHSPEKNKTFPNSDLNRMINFQNYLNAKGIICTIRSSRGEDIFAACGMLSAQQR